MEQVAYFTGKKNAVCFIAAFYSSCLKVIDMKRKYFLGLVIVLFSFSACDFWGERIEGNGKFVSETRQEGDVSKVKSIGNIDVVVKQGAASILVEADENLLPFLLTDKDDGWLKIHWKDDVNVSTDNPVKVTITSPAFEALYVTGSASIKTAEMLTSDKPISLKTTGSGNLDIQVHAPDVTAHVTGSGNIQVSGACKDADVHVTGSGRYDGQNLKAENVNANVTGSGDAIVFADETLDAKITGSGSLKYAGKATVKSKITGSGEVRKVE